MPNSKQFDFYLNWAKERLDEIDATLSLLESKAEHLQADTRAEADKLLSRLHQGRDAFLNGIKQQSKVSVALLESERARLESVWSTFNADADKFVETCGKKMEQQQAIFQTRSAAQLKAWYAMADRLRDSASEFAADKRAKISEVAKRMNAEAVITERKLEQLGQAGSTSWAAWSAALSESRAAFDRANQTAFDAFSRLE